VALNSFDFVLFHEGKCLENVFFLSPFFGENTYHIVPPSCKQLQVNFLIQHITTPESC